LQEPAGVATALRCLLQHQPDPDQLDDGDHHARLSQLLQLPGAQDIASADYAAALAVPLQQANECCTKLLCEQPAAHEMEGDDLFQLLKEVLQRRLMRMERWNAKQVWEQQAELLLQLPATDELDAPQRAELMETLRYPAYSR
jgi:hypothetical protein